MRFRIVCWSVVLAGMFLAAVPAPAPAISFTHAGKTLDVDVRNVRRQPLPTRRLRCRFIGEKALIEAAATGYESAKIEVPLCPDQQEYHVDLVLEDLPKEIEIRDLNFDIISSVYVDCSQHNVAPTDFAIDLFLPVQIIASPAPEMFLITDSLWWAHPVKGWSCVPQDGFHQVRLLMSRESYENIATVLWVVVGLEKRHGDREWKHWAERVLTAVQDDPQADERAATYLRANLAGEEWDCLNRAARQRRTAQSPQNRLKATFDALHALDWQRP